MKRREFVSLVGVGTVIPLAISSCTSQKSKELTIASPRSDGFQAIGTVSELNAQGQILAEKTALGKILVISAPADSKQLIAVKPTCTHAGCTVTYEKEQNAFVCPCHDSKFAHDGKVIQGPATQPLPTYIAKVEGDTVLVKVS